MNRLFRVAAVLPLLTAVCFPAGVVAQAVPSIRKAQVLRTRGLVEIEFEASDPIVPQTNLLKNPDRLVVDFVNAVPGVQLRSQVVNRAEVKSLRVGLFSAKPPVTRIVLDLAGPQPYKIFPAGRTVILKVGAGEREEAAESRANSGPMLTNSSYSPAGAHLSVEVPPPPRPALSVSYEDGLLSIISNKANLSEVLFAVHQHTGAEIAIPAGAEQEQVVAELGPAPAPEVLARLLNGSRFNFMILSSPNDRRVLERVILSSRPEGPMPPPMKPQHVVSDDDEQAEAAPPKPAPGVTPAPLPPSPSNQNSTASTDQPGQPGSASSPGTTTPSDNSSPQ